MKIGFIGAGNVASNLGELFKNAGHFVKFGVRAPQNNELSIREVCEFGEIVFLAIPFLAVKEVLPLHRKSLEGKIVVDVTNAINLNDWSPLFLGKDSGGEQIVQMLPKSKVVKAFNTIFADVMKPTKQQFDEHRLTAFVASDDSDAADTIKDLADEVGFHGIRVGGILNARYLEAMAHLNIAIALGGGGTDAGFIYFQRK